MGFFPISTDVILQDHKFRPIQGKVLMIGRQNTGLERRDVMALLRRYQIPPRNVPWEIDQSTIHKVTGVGPFITDRSFFYSFTDCEVLAMDVTDYEGADLIHDMSEPVPSELHNQFDFIFDGSSLDNIFDPAVALRSMHDMLKPGGRMVLINWTNSHPTAYAKLSPDWFMDFFAFHEYNDAKVIITQHITRSPDVSRIEVWQYDPYVNYSGQDGYQCSSIISPHMQAVICLAEKGNAPAKSGSPVQMHYRSDKQPYLQSCIRFHQSARKFDFSHIGGASARPSISTYETVHLLAESSPYSQDGDQALTLTSQPSILARIKSAYHDGRLISGVRRRLGI